MRASKARGGFRFSSDWLRKWREFYQLIRERINAKPKQTKITFDAEVKTTLQATLSVFQEAEVVVRRRTMISEETSKWLNKDFN